MLYVKGMVIGKLPHVKLPAPLSRKTAPIKFPPGLEFGFGLGFGSRAIFWGGGAIFQGKIFQVLKGLCFFIQ